MLTGPERERSHEHKLSVAMWLVPALAALALSLFEIGARSLWLDEAATVSIAGQPIGALGSALAHEGGNMLGYYALVHVLVGWFGSGSVAIRLPSAIGAAATAGITAALGRRLFGQSVGWIAGALAAISLTLVYWGQNARGYALMIAFTCGSFLFLIGLLKGERPVWRPWAGYVVCTTAAVYSGLEAGLVLPAQLILLAWRRGHARVLLGAVIGVGASCLPLAILAYNRGSGQLFWVPGPSFRTLKWVMQSLSSAGLEPNLFTGSGPALVFLTLGLVLAAAIRVLLAPRRAGRGADGWDIALVWIWLLVPMALDVAISEIGHSIFQARYMLVSLPAVALLLAWLLDGIWHAGAARRGRGLALRGVAAGLLAGLVALRILQLAPSYAKSTEPWRLATRYVAAQTRPGDCVAFYPLDARMPFRYYLGQRAPISVLPRLPWSQLRPYIERYDVPPAGSLGSRLLPCHRLWLVSSHAGASDGPPIARDHLRRYFSLLTRLELRYPNVAQASFGYAGIISVVLLSGRA